MSAEAACALDRRIAVVLHVGTWLASAVIALGLALPSGSSAVTVGIGLFIALPIVRVAVMLAEFLRCGDVRIGVISALVLAIIVLGIALGLRAGVTSGPT